jgi:hypothetical protein
LAPFGIDIAGCTNRLTNNGDADEEFLDQQRPMLLLLAQKEDREEMSLGRSKWNRKDNPHLWKGYNALLQ